MRGLIKSLTLFGALLLLVACGGGGSVSRSDTPANNGDTTDDPTISVELTVQDSDGNTDRALSVDNPLTIVATVQDSNGDPVTDTLITFSLSDPALADFTNDTGTARTDDDGVARLGITVGESAGDGQITATLPSGEVGTTTFSSSGSGSGGLQPAILQLFTSSVQLPSSGSDSVELIALVKNAQSVLMEGVEVSFFASNDAGVELQLIQPVTAADGTARALLSTQNNAANRTVSVTAQTGVLSQTVDITISGTEVTINGTSSVILNDTVEYTLRVQDSDGVAIPNQAITVSAGNGTLSADTVTTGSNGQATVEYTATESGADTITAEALNASASFSLTVQQDEFSFTTVPSDDVPLNQDTVIAVTWNQNGSPRDLRTVTFSTSRGQIVSGESDTTDASGRASFTLRSNNAGVAAITATGYNLDDEPVVTARVEIEFIATEPATIQADATPDLIGPDGQTSTITAIVRDADGNLVKNAVVTFNVNDTSTGSISPSQATTDSNGVASTVFTSGSVTSQDAVEITAAISGNTAISDIVVLTVGSRAFDVSVGTGNLIISPDNATYMKEFAVFVSDSVGRPVSGVTLTASSTPVKFSNGGVYRKGFWAWTGDVWIPSYTASCSNEDINANGILDAGEDTNGDNELTPGIIGTISFAGDAVTDENGQATLELRYPRAYAAFYESVVAVFAQSTGSEASASVRYRFAAAADDLDDEAEVPPDSPFGTGTLCTDTE
ncbi:Ig-like domain-containing protein [Alteromonas sp. CYL-A6]|uniref:Ig-like domain-containing protein n=1 Tax=Alteromonas nitratireducens TaxID=3390813 RepID=UPI0034C4DC63